MIPDGAEKKFEGIIFDVWQWEQEMFDGTTETFEILDREDTAEVIAIKDDRIMLQDQEQPSKPPFLCLPGGRINRGEDPLDGAKRELLEESGFVSGEWELFHSIRPTSKLAWQIHVFIARDSEFKQDPQLDAGEKIETKWVTFDELLDLVDREELNWIEQDLRMQFIRAKYHKPSYTALKAKIFGG